VHHERFPPTEIFAKRDVVQRFIVFPSLIDFFVVSADLFLSVLDVCVNSSAELSTGHHLVVCSVLKSQQDLNKYPGLDDTRNKLGGHGGQECKKDLCSVSSLFRELLHLLLSFSCC